MKVFTLYRYGILNNGVYKPDSGGSSGKLFKVMKKMSLLILLMFSTSILFAQTITNVHQTHPTGCSADDGIFNITAVKGTGVTHLQYSIDDGTTWQEEGVDVSPHLFTGLSDGMDYIILVRDRDNHADSDVWDNNPGRMYNVNGIYSQSEFTTDATCNGGSDGSATLVVDAAHSGGGNFTYELFLGAAYQAANSTGVFTGLEAGTYTIKVSNDLSCTYTTAGLVVSEAAAIAISVDQLVQVSCHDESDGIIEVSASNGVAPYQYDLYLGATLVTTNATGLFENLDAGTYKVQVTGGPPAFCMESEENIIVVNPDAIGFTTVSPTDDFCNDDHGKIDIEISGGTSPFTYTVDNGVDPAIDFATADRDASFENLKAGTYAVSVVDAKSCALTYIATVVEIIAPATFTITGAVAADANCFGGDDGTITITATGGTEAYAYSIDGVNYQVSNIVEDLTAGDYTVLAKDANGCEATLVPDVTVGEPAAALSIDVVNITDVADCYGDATGAIEFATVTGGTPPYMYSINDGATYQTGTIFNTLSFGTYNIWVKDANECLVDGGVKTINQPDEITVSALSSTNPLCNGDSNGEIQLTYIGGTGTLEYTIDAGPDTGTPQANGNFAGLTAGTYHVEVEDDNECTQISTITLTEPLPVEFTYTTTDINCKGDNTGVIVVTAIGGDNTYTYSIDGGAYGVTNTFGMLLAGNYDIQVKDGNGCLSSVTTVTLNEPTDALSFSETVVNVKCKDDATGSIMVTPSGGTADYKFSKDGGINWTDPAQAGAYTFSGLIAASYDIKIQDANLCESGTIVIPVEEPAIALTFTTGQTNLVCNGDSDGEIVITPAGGTSDYFFSKDNGTTYTTVAQAGPYTYTGLNAGAYDIIVKDANDCETAATTVTLTEPDAVTFTTVDVNVTCEGLDNGIITVTAAGGSGSYNYSKDAGMTWEGVGANVISSLAPGTYQIKVKDDNDCMSGVSPVVITEPTKLEVSATFTITHVECNGATTGGVDISVAGGTVDPVGDYIYVWTKVGDAGFSANTEDLTNVAAGTYNVLVTDDHMCTDNGGPYVITEPTATTIDAVVVKDNVCNGESLGEINITATPGSGSAILRYSIDGGNTYGNNGANVFTGLSYGTDYEVFIKDGNDCVIADMANPYTVDQPTEMSITLVGTISHVTCFGANDGAISVDVSGGTPGVAPLYTFDWSKDGTPGFAGTEDIASLGGGTYQLKVTDNEGCVKLSSVYTVTEPTALPTLTTVVTDVNCSGDNTGSIVVTPVGGTAGYKFSKDDGTTWTNPAQTGAYTFSGLAAASYDIKIQDANLCESGTIVIPVQEPALALSFTTGRTMISCFNGSDGEIVVTPLGGTADYVFSKDNGVTYTTTAQSGPYTFDNLASGSYDITVMDANNCEAVAVPIDLTQPDALSLDETITDITCYASADGGIAVTVNGGTIGAGTTYAWTGPNNFTASTKDISALVEGGNYTLTVIDDNSCEIEETFTVIRPDAVENTSERVQHVTCFGGSDGIIQAAAIGGDGNYTYSITAPASHIGDVVDANDRFSGLEAATYTIHVEDGNACTVANVDISIGEPVEYTFDVAVTDASCNGDNSGEILVKVKGGTPPLYVSIEDGAVNTYEEATFDGVEWWVYNFENLSAATYKLSATDANTCDFDYDNGGGNNDVIVGEPTDLVFDFIGEQPVNPCTGGANGSIKVEVSGGNAPYMFSLDGGLSYVAQSDPGFHLFDGLTAGFYSVHVQDVNLCEYEYDNGLGINEFEVSEPSEVAIDLVDIMHTTCVLDTDGSMTITASGGTGILEYSLVAHTDPATPPTYVATNVFTGLSVGDYDIMIRDEEGCFLGSDETAPVVVTVENGDVTPPNAICQDLSVELDEFGSVTILASQIDNGSTDNCEVSTICIAETSSYTISDVLESTDPTFTYYNDNRPEEACFEDIEYGCCGMAAGDHPYQISTIDIDIEGTYVLTLNDINGNVDFSAAIYSQEFNPLNICENLVDNDDDGNPNGIWDPELEFVVTLAPGVYSLVTFTYNINDDFPAPYEWTVNAVGDCQTELVFDCSDVGDNTIALTVTDNNGNFATCAATVTVEDNLNPEAVCQNLNVELDAFGQAIITADQLNNGSFDNCTADEDLVLQASQLIFDCSDIGENTVTLTVTDSYGNFETCDAMVTVNDNTLPLVDCHDVTLELDENGSAVLTEEMYTNLLTISGNQNEVIPNFDDSGNTDFTVNITSDVQVSFNWDYVTTDITFDWETFGYLLNGTYHQLTVDNAGSPQSGSEIITLESGDVFGFRSHTRDNAAGSSTTRVTAFTPGYTGQFESDNWTLTLDNSDGTAFISPSDPCGLTSVDITPNTFDCSNVGPNPVVVTVTDNNGNETICDITVTIEDNISPVFVETLPVDLEVECDAVPVAEELTATDNCSAIVTLEELVGDVVCDNTYTLTRTWTATDPSGNSVEHIQTIEVEDTTPPVFVGTLPADITVECDAVPEAVELTATDNCGMPTVVYVEERTDGDCLYTYTLTRTWTATDECGLEIEHVQIIEVEDTTAPVFVETLPANTTVECDAVQEAEVLTATDNCGTAAVVFVEVRTDGQCENTYTLTRTWTATDECELITEHVQIIEVIDTKAPVVAGGIDATNLEACGIDAAPVAQTTVAGLEALAGDLVITDACGDLTNFVVTSTDIPVGTCPIVITRTYTVADECGNEVSFDHIINIDDTFTIDVVSTDITCYDEANGIITVTAIDADCDLSYSIDGTNYSNTDGIFTDLIAGTYSVSVMNIHGCMTAWPTDIVIGEPDVLVVDDVITSNVTGCEGDENATITVMAMGGTPTYMYSIDNATTWQASNLFEDIAAGDYDIYVKDANDCISGWGTTISVNEPAPIVITLNGITNVDCFGNSTGAIAMTVSGGTPDFSYEWVGPNGYTADTESINGLFPGDYVLTVTDANACVEISGPHTVTEPLTALSIEEVISIDVTYCAGNMNGSIEIIASGGTPTYLYSLDNGVSYHANSVFENLGPGEYEITVRDANGCETVLAETITLIEPDAIDIVAVDVVNVMGCFGDASGEIHIDANGGTGLLRYSIDGGATYEVNDGIFTGLIAGTYQVKVKDMNGCKVLYDMPTVITEPTLLEVTEVITTDVSGCYGNDNGMIDVAAMGGTGNLLYSIDGGASYVDNSGVFTGLSAGTYDVFVTDESGCIAEYAVNSVVINQPNPMTILVTSVDVSTCNGGNDGMISINVTGGTADYSYSIDGGTTWSSSGNFTDLVAGDYDITIEDASGCIQEYESNPVVVVEPTELVFGDVAVIDAGCFEAEDGEIMMSGTGGTGLLMFSVDGGITYQESGDFTGLAAGEYTLMMMDANGCDMAYENNPVMVEDGVEILIEEVIVTNVQCSGELGSITITASGGVGDLMYSINGGTDYYETNVFTDLISDTYIVRVRDANMCDVLYDGNPLVIHNSMPSIVTITANPGTEVCTGADVELTAEADGAVSYTWSNGETTSSIIVSEMTAGVYEYTCEVENEEGCDSDATISIEFMGGSPVTIMVNPENGPYCVNEPVELEAIADDAVSFNWQPGGLSDPIIVVTSDVPQTVEYEVTVINSLGCESMASVEIEYDICESLPELESDMMTIHVYPNPSNGEFSLELTGISQEVQISVIDFAGRLVLEDKILEITADKMEKQFDLSNYEGGVYFLRITHGDKVSYKKVVIQ